MKIYRYNELGRANHGWLDARHHFSFASYHNPERMRFGALRVINDDIIQAGTGFDTHPHQNMEIITYVRQGAITHRDSNGNTGRTTAGDVQVMSAGTGVQHSEFNLEDEDTNIFQIWIEPNRLDVKPTWDSYSFPKNPAEDRLDLLVSGDGSAPLSIYQDAFIYGGNLNAGTQLAQPIKSQAYVLVSDGEVKIDGVALRKGDGAEITDASSVEFEAISDAKVLVLDVPKTAVTLS